jgi:hypothetical protein
MGMSKYLSREKRRRRLRRTKRVTDLKSIAIVKNLVILLTSKT